MEDASCERERQCFARLEVGSKVWVCRGARRGACIWKVPLTNVPDAAG